MPNQAEPLCFTPGCNHTHGAHQHYRPGDECGSCRCPAYRGRVPRDRTWEWLIAVLIGAALLVAIAWSGIASPPTL